jgi:hypothetical protein
MVGAVVVVVEEEVLGLNLVGVALNNHHQAQNSCIREH